MANEAPEAVTDDKNIGTWSDIPDEVVVDEVLEDSLEYDEALENLVPEFEKSEEGKRALSKLYEFISNEYDDAYGGSAQHREQIAEDWKVFTGALDKKTWPFENCANPNVPIALENISRLMLRSHGELFGDFTDVFGVKAIGTDDRDVATILSRHGNWQIRDGIPTFKRESFRAMLAFWFTGDVWTHSYYREDLMRNEHEVLMSEDVVIPCRTVSVDPNMADIPWMAKNMEMYPHQLELHASWVGVSKVMGSQSIDEDPEQPMADVQAEITGVERDMDSAKMTPRKIIMWEGWALLPNQEKHRWVQAYIHRATEQILSLSIHETNDWQDEVRMERQKMEKANWEQQKASWKGAMQQVQQNLLSLNAVPPGMAPPEAIETRRQQLGQMGQQLSQREPQMPAWMEDELSQATEPKKVPIRMWTHAVCLEPLTGVYGLSYGRMQADHNKAANTLLSQFIDAATLGNCFTFMTTDTVDFKDGLQLIPGKQNKVSGVTAGELKESILPFKPSQGNPQMVELVQNISQMAQSSVQAPNVLSGEPGKSGETFRGLSARIEQATKQLSVATRKFAWEWLEPVLRNNAWLNSVFLPDIELVALVDDRQDLLSQQKVTRDMYRRNYQVAIRADLRFSSQAQQIAEADELVGMTQIPYLQSNGAFIYDTLKGALEARGRPDLIESLGPRPPNPQMPPQQGPPPGAPGQGGAPGGQPGGAPPPAGIPGPRP